MTASTSPVGADAATVVVVGSLNIDLVVHAARLPVPGETLLGDRFATDAGGKGANQAVAAARMGARVAMIGRVGDDTHGQRLRDALMKEAVACEGVGTDADAPSGVASIVVGADGQNTIVVVPGANHRLDTHHVDHARAMIGSARVLVLQLEVPWKVVAAALSIARTAGVTTVLNAAPAAELTERQLADVDWLVVNETEAAAISGLTVRDADEARVAARALFERGPSNVVVTLGGSGVVHASISGLTHAPALEVQAIDSTGAGDSFVGTLAAALAEGMAPAEAIRWSQACAALSVTRRGTQSAMPTRDEVVARYGDPAIPATSTTNGPR